MNWRAWLLLFSFLLTLALWAFTEPREGKVPRPITLKTPAPQIVLSGPGVECRRAPRSPVVFCRCKQPERRCVTWSPKSGSKN